MDTQNMDKQKLIDALIARRRGQLKNSGDPILKIDEQPRETRVVNSFDIPEIKPYKKSINRFGPTYEISDPAQKITEESSKGLMEALQGFNSVNRLYDEANELIPPVEDPQEALFRGIGRRIGRSNLGIAAGFADEKAKSFEEVKNTFLGELSRSLSQERGVLTNQDIGRIKSSLPNEGDSTYVRERKRKFVNDYIKSKIDLYNQVASLLGKRGKRRIQLNAQ